MTERFWVAASCALATLSIPKQLTIPNIKIDRNIYEYFILLIIFLVDTNVIN